MPTPDEQFISIALEIASRGRGAVEPNPMVGAVLVRDGVELARGWHRRFGWPHAEVEALSAAEEAGHQVSGATLYVSLEPCCHFGKTPPCTRAIIEAGVARVVAAMADPDERVAGKGFAELRAAGIEVTAGVLEEQARELLAPYIKLRRQKRPWVICKWAQTADGLLALPEESGAMLPRVSEGKHETAREPGTSPDRITKESVHPREHASAEDRGSMAPAPRRWISCEESRADAHRLRGQCDGILVGVGTVIADDPMLTNRSGEGRQPARVVLDAHLRTPPDGWLAQTARTFPLIVATTLEGLAAGPERADALRRAGIEVLKLPAAQEGVSLPALLDELGNRQWTYLLVEGGAKVLRSFLYGRLADELVVYVSPRRGGGAVGPRFDIAAVLSDFPTTPVKEQRFGLDLMRQFRMVGPGHKSEYRITNTK
jgi:diaminohydroxyphosphoribosylaminopyrimidine deaminase/5-amino-6-(5-phosphoribosylamino)uracil reductase